MSTVLVIRPDIYPEDLFLLVSRLLHISCYNNTKINAALCLLAQYKPDATINHHNSGVNFQLWTKLNICHRYIQLFWYESKSLKIPENFCKNRNLFSKHKLVSCLTQRCLTVAAFCWICETIASDRVKTTILFQCEYCYQNRQIIFKKERKKFQTKFTVGVEKAFE